MTAAACATGEANNPQAKTDAMVADHMVVKATPVACHRDAAPASGRTAGEINDALLDVADSTVISEFWISGETDRVEFTSMTGLGFAFPTGPEAGTQAAAFANRLLGTEKAVTQGVLPREVEGAPFRCVGVAGVEQAPTVQVGRAGAQWFSAADGEERAAFPLFHLRNDVGPAARPPVYGKR